MAWSGGNFTRANPTWVSDASAGIGIEAARHDTQDNDFTTGIDQCLNKTGQNAMTGNLNLGGNLPTNIGAGTAAIPALCMNNDVNTGLFSAAADQIGIATNGTERVRIDASGKVGVGTTAPTYKVDIQTTDGTNLSMGRFDNTNAGSAVLITKSRGSSIGTNTIVQDADQLGAIIFQGANGTTYSSSAVIQAFVDGTPGASNDMPGRLVFSTSADSSGSPTERMRITSAGRVGIGTTAPGTTLHVGGATNKSLRIDSATNSGFIGVFNNSTTLSTNRDPATGIFVDTGKATAEINVTSVSGDGNLTFLTTTLNNTAPTQRMRIGNSGAVTINNATDGVGYFNVQYDGSTDDFAAGRNITGANYVVSKSIYDKTTVAGANVAVESTGGSYPVRRSTSSIKYKKDVVDLEPVFADKLHQFRPVFFKSKCFGDHPEWTHYGFIAEELAQIEPRFVSFGYQPDDYEDYEFVDADGKTQTAQRLKADAQPEPEGVYYDRIVTFLTSVVQRQQKKLEALEARIAALEA